MLITSQLPVAIVLHRIFPYYESQWRPATFFKISSVSVQQNKVIQIWNNTKVSKRWQKSFFSVCWLEVCKPNGSRWGLTRWVHLGRARAIFCIFFYRSGSGRTRAHLASLFLLCLCTRRAHMAAVWNTDYIVHRLRNAYMQALAYRWLLTTQSIREKSERGELLKVPNASGKAAFWIIQAFDNDLDSLSPHWKRI